MTRPLWTLLGRVAVDETTGCWNWTGKQDHRGYGMRSRPGERRAHRYAYAELVAAIPDGHDIHHKCRNPLCANPDHLEAIPAIRHRELHFLREKAGLTLDDVREIRRLGREPGVLEREVATRFGVHRTCIRKIWRDGRWGELTGDTERITAAPRPCGRPECEETIVGLHRHARYCSAACRRKANRALAKARAAA